MANTKRKVSELELPEASSVPAVTVRLYHRAGKMEPYLYLFETEGDEEREDFEIGLNPLIARSLAAMLIEWAQEEENGSGPTL